MDEGDFSVATALILLTTGRMMALFYDCSSAKTDVQNTRHPERKHR
jgi:hypothetical protein